MLVEHHTNCPSSADVTVIVPKQREGIVSEAKLGRSGGQNPPVALDIQQTDISLIPHAAQRANPQRRRTPHGLFDGEVTLIVGEESPERSGDER
jgi:hypothetical protein